MSTEAKIKHTSGECVVHGPSTGKKHYDDGGDYAILIAGTEFIVAEAFRRTGTAKFEPAWGNAALIARFREVPHHCSDPTCPGDRNRRLLEAGERLAEAVTTFNDPIVAVREALAAYQEAAK